MTTTIIGGEHRLVTKRMVNRLFAIGALFNWPRHAVARELQRRYGTVDPYALSRAQYREICDFLLAGKTEEERKVLSREARALAALRDIQDLVAEQSDDGAIWDLRCGVHPAKQALRELHDRIERHTIPLFEKYWPEDPGPEAA